LIIKVVHPIWREYDYEELVNRDKASLDIFWLRDVSLSDSDILPAPEMIAAEIVEDLKAALEQFREIQGNTRREITLSKSLTLHSTPVGANAQVRKSVHHG
jgi:hypothetical protein